MQPALRGGDLPEVSLIKKSLDSQKTGVPLCQNQLGDNLVYQAC